MKAIAVVQYNTKDYAKELSPLLENGYSINPIHIQDENVPADELIEKVKGYPYIIASGEYYTAEVLRVLADNGLKMITRMGVGYDHIDVAAAKELGVVIANTPGANANAVAEQALALTLAAARVMYRSRKTIESADWSARPWPVDLLGSTVGVIGFGNIARRYVRYMRPLASRIVAYDPYPNEAAAKELGVELVSLDELLAVSDVISLHVPLLDSTRNLIDAEALKKVKPNLVLVNTSRGGIVDEAALYDALKEGRIHGAGLDVYAYEPLPADDPLQTLDNCILAPHNASFTRAAFSAMMTAAVANLTAHIKGEPVPHPVN